MACSRVSRILLSNSMHRTVYYILLGFAFTLLCFPTSCVGSLYHGCSWDTCGGFEFSYPFGKINSGCGDPQFQLHCDQSRYLLLDISGDKYLILQPTLFPNGMENRSIKIINYNLWRTTREGKCNISGNYSHFWSSASLFHILADTYTNLTLWRHCNESINGENFQKWRLGGDDWYSISNPESGRRFCQTSLQLPISKNTSIKKNEDLITRLSAGFEITWYADTKRNRICSTCVDSKGSCGYNISEPSSTFLCYCPDSTSHPEICPANGIGRERKSAIVIGGSFGGVAMTAIAVLLLMFYVKRRRSPPGRGYSSQCESIPELHTGLCEKASVTTREEA